MNLLNEFNYKAMSFTVLGQLFEMLDGGRTMRKFCNADLKERPGLLTTVEPR